MDRAFLPVTIRSVSEDERLVEGWATRPETDRVGDVVMPEGATFKLPIPFLLDHDHTEAVGEVERADVTAAGIRFVARIKKIPEPGLARDLVDRAWHLIKHGLRKTVSIGFNPLRAEPIQGGGLRFLSWEWLELSAVSVPALASATITGTKRAGVVRLSDPIRGATPRTHSRVVKLSDPIRGVTRRPVSEAMRAVADKSIADRERRKALGDANCLMIDAVAAGARATDVELAELAERLARLERKA